MKAIYFDESDPLGVKFLVKDIPSELAEQAELQREALVEALSDFDDLVANKFVFIVTVVAVHQ